MRMLTSLEIIALSCILSDVMDDIGVNDKMVMERRRASMLKDALGTVSFYKVRRYRNYTFGSQSEGSTTLGLGSDLDDLFCFDELNVIQHKDEYQAGSNSLLVIQNDIISPGYCHLQLITSLKTPDQLVISGILNVLNHCVTDSEGRLVLKNTLLTDGILGIYKAIALDGEQYGIHGPAITKENTDVVYCFHGKTLPYQVKRWLQKMKGRDWPTDRVLEECRKAGCFFVPVDSKLSNTPKLGWRISTHLQERYLMFSLNITQLRCYILMKIILKTFIFPCIEDVLSSYMCKNVVFYCIYESSHYWHAGTLLTNVQSCMARLYKCIEQSNCPHFIIQEKNLLAGRMSKAQQNSLLEIVDKLVGNMETEIFNIHFDRIRERLNLKLGIISNSENTKSAETLAQHIAFYNVKSSAIFLRYCLDEVITALKKTPEIELVIVTFHLNILKQDSVRVSDNSNMFPHYDIWAIRAAYKLLISLLSSAVGSILAGRAIDSNIPISSEAFAHLTEGKDCDVLSGRLKLVSVLYCTGDMMTTMEELELTLKNYIVCRPVISVCACYSFGYVKNNLPNFTECVEKSIRSKAALCVTFTRHEIRCIPRELRYEILRSHIVDDTHEKTKDSLWMDFIAVDSIPFLHYLQYKTYGDLHRRGEQLQSIQKLADVIVHEPNLGHRETALNVLGQCCEKENIQTIALKCYISSLKHRKRRNAARLLICLQLFKLKNK